MRKNIKPLMENPVHMHCSIIAAHSIYRQQLMSPIIRGPMT